MTVLKRSTWGQQATQFLANLNILAGVAAAHGSMGSKRDEVRCWGKGSTEWDRGAANQKKLTFGPGMGNRIRVFPWLPAHAAQGILHPEVVEA